MPKKCRWLQPKKYTGSSAMQMLQPRHRDMRLKSGEKRHTTTRVQAFIHPLRPIPICSAISLR
jgi:hypothetical protein